MFFVVLLPRFGGAAALPGAGLSGAGRLVSDRAQQLMRLIFVVIAWRTCSPGLIVHNNVVTRSGTTWVQRAVEGACSVSLGTHVYLFPLVCFLFVFCVLFVYTYIYIYKAPITISINILWKHCGGRGESKCFLLPFWSSNFPRTSAKGF